MRIKNFLQFINEELISDKDGKPFNLDEYTNNCFVKFFNSDTLAVKEFIQREVGKKNLKFLGGGCIGLAFLGDDGKVIKLTADKKEKKGVDRMIELTPGNEILPGFAKYYWIKEVDLPTAVKSINHDLPGSVNIADAGKIKQMREIQRRLKAKNIDPKRKYELEQRLKRLGDLESDQEFIDRRRSNPKINKVYLICLENLRLPTDIESALVSIITTFFRIKYFFADDKDNFRKLSEFFDWLHNDEEVYQEKDFVNRQFYKEKIVSNVPGLTKKLFWGTGNEYKEIWMTKITKDYFMEFSQKVLNLYSIGKKYRIPTSDIHSGNVGFRGDELVAFDCM